MLALVKVAVEGGDSAGKWLRGGARPRLERRRAAQREFPSCVVVVRKSSACLTPNAGVQTGGDWAGLGETEAPAGLPLAPGAAC